MTWDSIPRHPSERMLRQFAVLWILFWGWLACWQGLLRQPRHMSIAACFILLAIGVGGLGLVSPQRLRPVFVGWMILVYPLNYVLSHLVLGLVLYGLFTPLAILFRLLGRDVLQRRFRPEEKSYWATKPKVTEPRSYFRQF